MKQEDEDALRKLDRELAVATYENDFAWFEKHLSDDYVLITSSGKVMERGDVIREIGDTSVVMEPYHPTEVGVREYGDTAVVTGRIRQRYTTSTQRVDADLRYTDIWRKNGTGWIHVTGHASPITVIREDVQ